MTLGRVLVTGATQRVGRAIAIELARRGCDLSLTWHTAEDNCAETASLCRAAATESIDISLHELALENEDSINALIDAIELEPVDGVVHNASLYETTPLENFDFAHAERMMRVNAIAPLAISARLAPMLKRSRLPNGAAIVCLGDTHAMGRPRRNYAAYLASKSALERVVQSLALEFAPAVRVNAVAPGVVAWAENEMTEEQRARYLTGVPMARAGTAEEAATAVAFLLLDASYTTGSTLRVDGGGYLL